jgi:hypothetical protein
MTDDQNEYMIHNPQIYGIGPFDDNSKNTSATNNTTLVDTLDGTPSELVYFQLLKIFILVEKN